MRPDFQPIASQRQDKYVRLAAMLASGVLSLILLLSERGDAARSDVRSAISTASVTDSPVVARHEAGRLGLLVSNRGEIGWTSPNPVLQPDFVTGDVIDNGSEFPIGSGRRYLYSNGMGLWIGGIRGRDTLVTTTNQDEPQYETVGIPVNGTWLDYCRSIDAPGPCQQTRRSDEDFAVAFTDTVLSDDVNYLDRLDYRPHKPLQIEVTEDSYVWSYSYSQDIVFFHLDIRNFGRIPIEKAFIGLFVHPHVKYSPLPQYGQYQPDDVVGYVPYYLAPFPCGFQDTVEFAWAADNDGDPLDGAWIEQPVPYPDQEDPSASTRGAMGFRILRAPAQGGWLSFNWWSYDFDANWDYGPMQRDRYRDYHTGSGFTGWPGGDRNRYFMMGNGESDFASPFTAVTDNHGNWLTPQTEVAANIADGQAMRFVLSTGPVTIAPGARTTVDFCIFAAENFHVDPNNGRNLPHNPWAWYDNVNFSSLAKNAVWAQRIYDNPGVDTDGDGYFGESRVCVLDSALVEGQWVAMVADTEWYKGDGVPDWRASTPPIAPYVWVEPIKNGLHVRINGEVSETAKDVLTETVDFEGYRVYLGRDERKESFSLVASYDKDNYDKWVFDSLTGEWSVREDPFTLEQLRCLCGTGSDPCHDSSFVPSVYFDRGHYFQMEGYPDSVFFFTPHDRNSSGFGINTPLTKTYPDMPDPRILTPEQLTPEMYTEDGHFKYYEYQMEITDLLPTVGYFVSVTSFDFGSPASGVAPLETEVTEQPVEAFPLHELDQPLSGSDEIFVYPNPYRIDVDYRGMGLEGRNQDDRWDERVRAVWFANLPPKCTIHIFTIDGDRVRTMIHDVPVTDPTYRRHAWDLINRNFQKIESGLYYWVVEIPGDKTQVGKLAVIR